ncbi:MULTISPECIES: DMT family transporter [unclassified Pseudomonas]|uniref:DMT family transporter n=1 Tax=unclassified Pseudomonas TaxID=196821 RepID=UPI000D382630|nr:MULTISPECIES: DMT family transporter [unclassified Pseudomonas]RAU47454.1 DMT family transporter [Pseudomonas sp. RIT 409]RAU51871.1 DMT family transporter [Pseudomonas sp. RIT 412]
MNTFPQARHDDLTPPPKHRRLPLPLLEAGLLLTWSSGFIGARFSIDYAPALLVVFWRCIVVCLVLLPFVYKALLNTPPRVLLCNAGIGLLAMAGYLTGVTQGIQLGVPAGLAALCADLLPLGMAVLAAVFLGERLVRQVWLGLIIGLAGVIWVTQGALALGDAPLWAYGLPVAGMLSLAIATLWQKKAGTSLSMGLLPNLWWQCFVSSFAFAAIQGSQGSLAPIPTAGFALSVLWTVVLATFGGYGLYWVCLRRSTATRVASVLYLSPSITLLWAWAMFDEALSWQMASGMAISAVGIWLVVRGEAQPAQAAPAPSAASPSP